MQSPTARVYLANIKSLLRFYKNLGEKAIQQLDDTQINQALDDETNSVAMLVRHMSGNMKSRFTDFLSSDGEKEWRNRDQEFEPVTLSKQATLDVWEEGWKVVFDVLDHLRPEELDRRIFIRNEPHTVLEAFNRQLGHYAYHVGQIVLLARFATGNAWDWLSIPKGESRSFNQEKFGEER